MELSLRIKSGRVLRRLCGAQTILPRSCIISENISKEGEIAFASEGFAQVWKGHHNGNSVCIKVFCGDTTGDLSKIKRVRTKQLHA